MTMQPGFDVVAWGTDKTFLTLRRESEAIRKETIRALHEASQLVRTAVVKLASGPLVHVRSGAYRASVQAQVDDQALTAQIGTGIRYARMVEWGTERMPGGRMLPKKAKFLAIPLSSGRARTKAGVGKKPSDFAGEKTFVRTTPSGQRLMYLRKDDKVGAIFVLKSSVRIKGRHVFATAFEATKPEIGARFSVGIRMAVGNG